MSTKRTRNTSATEPPLTPKRRSASLSTAKAEVVEKGKRKIVVVGDDAGQSPTKSPKKAAVLIAITSAVTRRSSRKSLAEEEQRREVVLDDFIEERRPRTTRSKGIVPSEEVPVTVPAKVPVKRLRPRSLRRFSPSAEEIALMQGGLHDFGEDDDDDDVVTLSVKAPRDPITTRSRTAPASQDARKFYVAPVLFKESNKQEESVSLAERYWFTMYNCFRTLAPLFLAIVVFLYAVSASTNSQKIASVGLAYAFVFLGIMATFYCTALPLIVASNMVSRFIFSNGASMQKDLTRALLFFLTIGCVLFFAYYPIGLF